MCAGQDRDLPRSMDKAFEGPRPGKADLSEQCCYWGYRTPLQRGVMVPYKHHLARSHILFPRFLHSLDILRSWVVVCD
jgi:hypothetical protein